MLTLPELFSTGQKLCRRLWTSVAEGSPPDLYFYRLHKDETQLQVPRQRLAATPRTPTRKKKTFMLLKIRLALS